MNRAGFHKPVHTDTGEAWEYFIIPAVWRSEVCKGFDPLAVARLLQDRGWLIGSAEKDRIPRVRLEVKGQGRLSLIHISHEFLEAEL